MSNSRLNDAEVLETCYPVQVRSFSLRPHSGGKGKYSRGNGVISRIKFLGKMTANILSSHRLVPPFGLKGAAGRQVGCNWV
jgi:N-methylhydantoinase B